MVTSRRLKRAAVIAAVAGATAVVRFAVFSPDLPPIHPPPPPDATAVALRELPRLHRFVPPSRIAPARADAVSPRRTPTPGETPAVPLPDVTVETAAPPAVEPPLIPHAATTGENDRFLPQLTVCRPDQGAAFAAADIIQDCINRAPAFSAIEIPAGTYTLRRQILIGKPLTLRTAGSAGSDLACTADATNCAVLVAAADLLDRWGPLAIVSTTNVTLEHLVVDGNGGARGASRAAELCSKGDNTYGFNVAVLDCVNCGVDDVVSRHALCGTGMVWTGGLANIRNSAFVSNGNAGTGLWSDGLTLLYAPRSVVRGNRFVDNSDVSLILGYGVQARVEDNLVLQREQPAFAGLMLHNFGSRDLTTGGDFRGATIARNTVDCGSQLCVFGIQVGPSPWDQKVIVIGGELHDNQVRGAKIGINVDGAGVMAAPIAIYDNVVSAVPESAYFASCARRIATDVMNISPTSVVYRGTDATPTSAHLSDMCQLSSPLTAGDR